MFSVYASTQITDSLHTFCTSSDTAYRQEEEDEYYSITSYKESEID